MEYQYDLFISFKEAFRPDELDGVISEIRRYVPVILVDEDERFSFLDKSEWNPKAHYRKALYAEIYSIKI